MRQNRRNFIRSSIAGASIPVFLGKVEADEQSEISIRRSITDPISSRELDEIRMDFVREVLSDSDSMGDIIVPTQNNFNGDYVVAYDLQINDGAPEEFIGTVSKNEPQYRIMTDSKETRSVEDAVSEVHNAADQEKKWMQSASDSVTATGTNPDNWNNWSQISKTKDYATDIKGNTFGWTVRVKENPEDAGVIGVESEGRMDPAANNPNSNYFYINRKNVFNHNWRSGSVIETDMFDHEPQNQGVGDKEWVLKANIGLMPSVTVGTTDTINEGGVAIIDRSSPDRGEYAKSTFKFTRESSRERYSEINSVSVANVEQWSYETVVDVELNAVFGSPRFFGGVKKQKIDRSFSYNMFGI